MADKEGDEVCVCDQCEKTVAASNFALHESHCHRFLCLCPDCEESVPRLLLEQHRREEHSQVTCNNCNKKMERCQLLEHESVECEARLQCCEFCELELPMSGMAEHSTMCGSRTERCSDCGRYVTLKDQRGHTQNCPDLYSPGDVSTNTVRSKDGMSFPLEKKKTHQLDPGPDKAEQPSNRPEKAEQPSNRPEKAEQPSNRPEKAEQPSPSLASSLNSALSSNRGWRQEERDGNMDQINTCPHCHLALPLFTLQWHEAKCQIHVSLK